MQPLDGIRVLDVSGRIGAYCTKVLADLGADVVKAELPTGDQLRFLPPRREGACGPEAGLLFAYYHHNKRGITLDWERVEALPLLAELAVAADVVVASPKGERRRLAGFVDDPPSLSWVPDGVLTCFITPFGLTGPYREWRSTPFTSFAMSGCMHPVGPPEGPPVAMPGQQLYDEAGIAAAFLVQATLRGQHHPRSQVIDHSVHEAGLFKQLGQEPYSLRGRIKTRQTNFGAPPSGIWKCADGLVDIAVHTPQQWDVFLELVGRPDQLTDPIYRERKMRIQLFDLVGENVADLLSSRSATQFVTAGQAAGLPCALTHTGAEFVESDQLRARQFLTTSSREGTGVVELPGRPFASDPELTGFRRSAPRLGEANEDVYVGELGHSRDELTCWRADGLV
ncbi:MAG: CoA transferase [Acidimicrobiales bacterium]